MDPSTESNGLEIVFKYAHHSKLLPDLGGLTLLHNTCNEMNVARYVESAPARGYTPTTPGEDPTLFVSPSKTGADIVTVAADLSKLDQVISVGQAEAPSSAPSTTNPRGKALANEGDYIYRPKSTHGAALAFVFHSAMRDQSDQKITAARERKMPTSSLLNSAPQTERLSVTWKATSAAAGSESQGADTTAVSPAASPVASFMGLQMLHGACLRLKVEEPHKFLRFPDTTWDSHVTRYQHERFLMGCAGMSAANGGPVHPGPPLADSQFIDASASFLNPPTHPPNWGPNQKQPARRVTTAQRIARRAQNLKGSLTEIKTMIDARAYQAKHQATGGATLRAQRLKKFASSLPKPTTQKRQTQQGAGTLGGTLQPGFLPQLASTQQAGLMASVGDDKKEQIRLPRLNRTQGDGNNCPEGGRAAGLGNSRAGQLVKQFDGEGLEVAGSSSQTAYLRNIKHRFTNGGPAQPKSSEVTARRLMM